MSETLKVNHQTLEPSSISLRRHSKTNWPGSLKLIFWFCQQILVNIPALFALRDYYAQQNRKSKEEPVVLWIGDNLDEVNGIAITSRIMIRKLREQGKKIFLWGVAFHTKQARSENADGSVVLVPGPYSMDQAGYPHSELAIPYLRTLIDFLKTHRVDIIEFQTPGPVAVMGLWVAKIVGIRTLSHYRTDILTYSKLLVKNKPGVWGINTWTILTTRLAGQVIVPSQAYAEKIHEEMNIPLSQIVKLPRGVDLSHFHPDKKNLRAWEKFNLPKSSIKLLYVGRISFEKNLALFTETFPKILQRNPDITLTVVGGGPYCETLKENLAHTGKAFFPGILQGDDLTSLIASADIFVFPSNTDTFGNSVIEALASGVPCITSNQGGPQEIIENGLCGFVFDAHSPQDFINKVLLLAQDQEKLAAFKLRSRERALQFTYDRSAESFWNYYRHIHQSFINTKEKYVNS